MPNRPLRPCKHPGCPALTEDGRCDKHRTQVYDRDRGTAGKRGYDARWRRYRAWFIVQVNCPECGRNHVLCEGECRKQGRVTATFAVDHKIPHRGDVVLFWDHSNLQGLCESEHNAKARAERLT